MNNPGKRTILIILPSMEGGGAEKVASILLRHLSREKFLIKLVLFKKEGEYLENIPIDIETIDLCKKSRWDFFNLIYKLRKLVVNERPDTLFSMLEYANVVTILACLFLRNGPKVVISERINQRMYLPHDSLKKIKFIMAKFAYKRASKIVTISNGIKAALIEDFGISSDRIEVIHNPIDMEEIERLGGSGALHPFFAHRQNHPVIISIGRLVKEKNLGLLLKAVAVVRQRTPVYLIIMGQGCLNRKLQELCAKLEINNYVDFVNFQINPFSWLKRSDLFVLSSHWEGFGNVIVEAMACGTPVIATNCPSGPGEIITDKKNGMLVRANDADALAGAISYVLDNESVKSQLIRGGLERARDFDIKKTISEYQAVL